MLPVIALVGRPNVGKSTLFNVLTKSRDALVADFPGLTRDRKYGHGEYENRSFIVIDTGGLSGESEELDSRMAKQTLLAIEEANLVLLLVDARDGLTAADEAIANQLRRTGKALHLIVNKIDGLDENVAASEFAALGFTESHNIAAAHGRGVAKFLEILFADWPEESEQQQASDVGIKVAVVGKPNVGKSTLINRLLGEERVVVMDMPGTTRDSIYIPFEHQEKRYTLIDTAGVRRKKSVSEAVEKFSVIKTLQAIDESNVVIMMIDAREGVTDQDLHLLGYIVDAGRALVIVINKWDGMEEDEKRHIKEDLERRLGFVNFADIFFISALHGSNVGLLYKSIQRSYASATRDLSTPKLTAILEKATTQHQPPLVQGRRIKLRYAHQGGQNPPLVVIHGNQTELVPAAYKRYLINVFIQQLDLKGSPLRLEFKTGTNPYAGRKNELSGRQINRKKRMIRHIKKSEKAKARKKKNG